MKYKYIATLNSSININNPEKYKNIFNYKFMLQSAHILFYYDKI